MVLYVSKRGTSNKGQDVDYVYRIPLKSLRIKPNHWLARSTCFKDSPKIMAGRSTSAESNKLQSAPFFKAARMSRAAVCHEQSKAENRLPKVVSNKVGNVPEKYWWYVILLMVQQSGKLTSWENGSLSHYLQGFKNIPGGWEWDFWTVNMYLKKDHWHHGYPPLKTSKKHGSKRLINWIHRRISELNVKWSARKVHKLGVK